MATIKQGINGPFSGGIGNAVGSSWKGIGCMRSYASKISNPRTDLQQDHRQKIAVTMKFLRPLTQLLNIGFKTYTDKMTAINAAMSYNYHNALQGTYPDNIIDFNNVLISRGPLTPALNQKVVSMVAGTIIFTWDDNSDEADASPLDKSLLVVYNPEKNQAVFFNGLSNRVDGTQPVTVPNSFTGDQVHCYLGFITVDGNLLSNSRYAGAVTVA
jgi:hypothetical protein